MCVCEIPKITHISLQDMVHYDDSHYCISLQWSQVYLCKVIVILLNCLVVECWVAWRRVVPAPLACTQHLEMVVLFGPCTTDI